ncbi:hypothetical protein IPT12_15010 [Xanthomonas perforans]|uniref:Uncharacterized protein n=2 Tax=Xanthomonas perforans TaxID=442694 RepID=A0A6P0GX10_XANPE|nr:hypothetical protein [Xanthomonas perforans]KLC44477.1 hypothetical protein XP1712_15060 [Xanthomonas perforans]MBZ2413745.1 hypothetical protein [Xanthomonas perforans]MBZ2422139.1 hypothetical protein [Xanthomonas perforans]MBZ2426403.1 hypothetical protein [Xanthomonas perforans]MBZ2430859.1 hypothetical protein [Xanthomonas perforans]
MAKEKIFHVVRKSDQSENLVRAPKESGVLLVLAGNSWKPSIATQDDITNHYAAGGTLHPASIEADIKGAKIVRLAPAEGSNKKPVLIRAKNVGSAIEALTNGDIEIKLADQETLVRLLEAGTKVLEAPKPEVKTNPDSDPDPTRNDGANADTGTGKGVSEVGAGDNAANDGQNPGEKALVA